MIHLLFDPNELLFNPATGARGPLYDKLSRFEQKGLVYQEGNTLYWAYPGDLLLDTPVQSVLDAYSYYDIAIFIELLNGDLTFMGWSETDRIMVPVSIYAQLGLPLGFDLENHISDYLNEFSTY